MPDLRGPPYFQDDPKRSKKLKRRGGSIRNPVWELVQSEISLMGIISLHISVSAEISLFIKLGRRYYE